MKSKNIFLRLMDKLPIEYDVLLIAIVIYALAWMTSQPAGKIGASVDPCQKVAEVKQQ